MNWLSITIIVQNIIKSKVSKEKNKTEPNPTKLRVIATLHTPSLFISYLYLE